MQLRSADECRLVADPKLFDTVECIRKDDAAVAHADLEDRPVLLAPFRRFLGLVVAESVQVADDG